MRKVGFVAFFLMWAGIMRWQVPDLHVRICLWMEECRDQVRVLEVFRGAAKSTLYGIYKAWRIYCDPTHRSLVWSADAKLAKKMTRDVLSVLRRHPLCKGILPEAPGIEEFWAAGATDARNPTMAAYGVLSNVTGGRADDVDFDDVEVPKNIWSAEGRERLRERISESTHVLVPGGQKTYIGTPHTHDSIYDEQTAGGAPLLKIPLFEDAKRYEGDQTQTATRYIFDFDPGPDGFYVFVGIGKFAKLLVEGADYLVDGRAVSLKKPPANVLDIYAGCAWPERFNRADLQRRRKDTPTLNGWDSQYQLEAKPLHAVRLDPDDLIPYAVQPEIHYANGGVRMMLGKVQIVAAGARWDCALGRLTGDVSAFGVMFTDAVGNYYWHVAEALMGSPFEQCQQIKKVAMELQIPRVTVETNGPGAFAPALLRKALKGTGCAVGEDFSTENKNKRILEAFEAPLRGGFLWAHVDVIATVEDEMRDWKPTVKEQPDNHLDAGSGAIKEQPMRVGKVIGKVIELDEDRRGGAWRTDPGVHEVTFEVTGE